MLTPQQQGFAKLVAMIDALEVGMLTTEDKTGALRSRPMVTQRMDDGVLWFFTRKDAPKVEEVQLTSDVNVSYADPNNQIFVSISGIARTSSDRAKMRELWSLRSQRWFPEGPDDAQLALLSVEINQAEYWDVDTRSMIQLVERHAPTEAVGAATDHRKFA